MNRRDFPQPTGWTLAWRSTLCGLNIDETAEALQVSTATVERDWTVSKAWLHQRLSS